MDFLKSIEFASISDAIKTGVIDHHKLYEKGFIGTSKEKECFLISFDDSFIDSILDSVDTTYPLFFIRGANLAKAFLERNESFEGEGYFEFVYTGEKMNFELQDGFKMKKLDLSYFDIVRKNYHLADDEYIKNRLDGGFVTGLFDNIDSLVGFVGEHYEGAMGMLEVMPEYRKRGYGTILEKQRINQTLSEHRTPYCNVLYGNDASLELQHKLGLKKTSLDTWWVWRRRINA